MNGLSDGVSSLLTILGFYWAKPADKNTLMDTKRAEYINGFVVAIIIIIIGFNSSPVYNENYESSAVSYLL